MKSAGCSMLPTPLPDDKKLQLEGILDRFRTDAFKDSDVTFLALVKVKGHQEIMLECGGDEAERELLMAFFMKWAFTKSSQQLKA